MVQEAERNADEDKKRREVIDLKNQVILKQSMLVSRNISTHT